MMNTKFTLKNVEVPFQDDTIKVGELSTEVEGYDLAEGFKFVKALPKLFHEIQQLEDNVDFSFGEKEDVLSPSMIELTKTEINLYEVAKSILGSTYVENKLFDQYKIFSIHAFDEEKDKDDFLMFLSSEIKIAHEYLNNQASTIKE